jgi:hypothetical protein
MSRVDFVVDGETREQAHPNDMTDGDVRISFDGGDTFPLEVSRWEHVVIEVDTEPQDE